MISPEEAIRARILEGPGNATALLKRIYPQIAPQGAVLPYVVYTRISGAPVHHIRGPTGLARARIQVDTFAATYSQALAISNANRKALDGWRGPIVVGALTLHVSHLFLDNEASSLEGPLSGSEDPIHRFMQDFVIAYQQEVYHYQPP